MVGNFIRFKEKSINEIGMVGKKFDAMG